MLGGFGVSHYNTGAGDENPVFINHGDGEGLGIGGISCGNLRSGRHQEHPRRQQQYDFSCPDHRPRSIGSMTSMTDFDCMAKSLFGFGCAMAGKAPQAQRVESRPYSARAWLGNNTQSV